MELRFFAVFGACCLTLLPLAAQSPIRPAPIDTDRPDVTDSAVALPRHTLQFENGATWTRGGEHRYDLTQTLVRFGITDRFEVRFEAPNYLGAAPKGFENTSVGFKQQLGPFGDSFDLSMIVAVRMPTGSSAVSSRGYDPYIKFPWAQELRGGWSVGGMQSFFSNSEREGRSGEWQPTLYLEKELGHHFDVFAEYVGDFAQRAGPSHIAHFGSAYKLSHTHQIDCHFGFGLSPAAPARFVAVGYSFRVDRFWRPASGVRR